MPAVELTERFIAGLWPASRTVYFDAKTKGLALRVSPRGARTWAFVYRSGGRPPQWVTLGTYPALGLADARARALDKRHAIDVEKRDPAAEERAARTAAAAPAAVANGATFTFADLVGLYEAFAKGRKKTWRDDLAMARRHLLPVSTLKGSRMTSEPRAAAPLNSLLASSTIATASWRFARASASVALCVLAPGNSSTNPMYPSGTLRKTAVNWSAMPSIIRRGVRPNKRLQPTAAGAIMSRRA